MLAFFRSLFNNTMEEIYPQKRSGHVAVVWNGIIFVWGGYYTDVENDMFERRHSPQTIWKYYLDQKIWSMVKTEGFVPPSLLGSCCTCYQDQMIVFGGISYSGDDNNVYSLDLIKMKWKKINLSGTTPSGRNKLTCCVYKNKVIYFGGYGPLPKDCQIQNGQFDEDITSIYKRGWNNHLFAFDIDENCWITLANAGVKPSSRAAHACAALGDRAFIHGGRHKDKRLDDMHILCLNTFVWTQVKKHSNLPTGRSWHSLNVTSENTLLLFGGLDTDENILDDCWHFSTGNTSWKEAPCQNHPRLWHTACRGAYLGEVVVFGGCKSSIFSSDPQHCNSLVVFNIQPKSLLLLCLEVLSTNTNSWKDKQDALPLRLVSKLFSMAGNGG